MSEAKLTWQDVRERIVSLGHTPVMDEGQVKEAAACADALEYFGMSPPSYAWHTGGEDRFTFGWHGGGYMVEFRSDGTCRARKSEKSAV